MSGISVFCLPSENFSTAIREKIFNVLNKVSNDIEGDLNDSEITFYVEKEISIRNRKYEIRDDFSLIFNDSDLILNYPDLLDSDFKKKNSINYSDWSFSLSTMVNNQGTKKVIIDLLSQILPIVGGIVVFNFISNEMLTQFDGKLNTIKLTSNKVIYSLNSEIISILNELDEELKIE